jgi:hypothetical protein
MCEPHSGAERKVALRSEHPAADATRIERPEQTVTPPATLTVGGNGDYGDCYPCPDCQDDRDVETPMSFRLALQRSPP